MGKYRPINNWRARWFRPVQILGRVLAFICLLPLAIYSFSIRNWLQYKPPIIILRKYHKNKTEKQTSNDKCKIQPKYYSRSK